MSSAADFPVTSPPAARRKIPVWAIVVFVLVDLLIVLAIVIAVQPGTFRVERSADIPAPAAALFDQVNTLRAWEGWSPWAKRDPDARITYAGPAAGQGASFSWDGNDEVGKGQMTITESQPPRLVRFRIDFERPMTSTHTVEFHFEQQGDQTRVQWAMFGENDFFGKAFSLFVDCDKLIGADLEQGLANLRQAVAEAK